MPHIKIQMYPGRDQETIEQLSQSLCECVCNVLQAKPDSVSVSLEQIEPENWYDKVVKKELLEDESAVLKWPGYEIKK